MTCFHRFRTTLLCLCCTLPGPLLSAEPEECARLPAPSVTVRRLEEPISLNTTYSYRALTGMSAKLGRGETRVLGLTRGMAIVEFASKTASFTDRTGQWECVSPQLTLTYGFRPMHVYVAREFPAGSCAHKEILEHELRHVQTYQTHIAQIEKDISATLQKRFVGTEPWRGRRGQIRQQLETEINERWIPYIQREINRVDSEQALIDTDEEYQRVANACNGEIRKLVR